MYGVTINNKLGVHVERAHVRVRIRMLNRYLTPLTSASWVKSEDLPLEKKPRLQGGLRPFAPEEPTEPSKENSLPQLASSWPERPNIEKGRLAPTESAHMGRAEPSQAFKSMTVASRNPGQAWRAQLAEAWTLPALG